LISLALLSYPGPEAAMAAGEGVKDIEVAESAIDFDRDEFPHFACLRIELKNNGDKSITNLNLEVSYYDAEGYTVKRVILKDRLTEAIPPGEARKYKIRLNGDVFNERNEEYPYSQRGEVDDFDVKILNVKFGRK